jgi:uncharacterized protein YdhG (YjbR/CyaY superfamily)
MSTAQIISTHDNEVAEMLAQIQRAYPDLGAQDAFILPGWYYKQTCWIEDSVGSENAVYNLPIAVRITGAKCRFVMTSCVLYSVP